MSYQSKINQLDKEKDDTETELRQLKNRQKVLLSKESEVVRKARTRRLIQHGGALEKVFPLTTELSDDELVELLFQMSRLPEVEKLVSEHPSPLV